MKWKRSIAFIVGIMTISSIVISLLLPKTYRGEATIMPITNQKSGSLAMAASQMGLGGLLGAVGNGSSTSSQLMAILNSRTLAETVIEKFSLMKVLFKKDWDEEQQRWKNQDPKKIPSMEDAVKALRRLVIFDDDKKDQVINVKAVFESPQLAADVTNGYIKALEIFLRENTFTMAKKNRIFTQGQLERNRAELLEAGKALSEFYSQNKISNVVPKLDVSVDVPKYEDMGSGEGSIQNVPGESVDLQAKLDAVRAQLAEVKTVKEVPQQMYLQYLTIQRELLVRINALFTQQYEMAKIDEAKEELAFQVIDWARVPVRKFTPKRAQIVVATFLLSSFFGVFYAAFREYIEKHTS